PLRRRESLHLHEQDLVGGHRWKTGFPDSGDLQGKRSQGHPQVIVAAIDSREFRGVKELSWGWLTAEGKHNGRTRFMMEIKKRLPNNLDCPDNEPPLGADW